MQKQIILTFVLVLIGLASLAQERPGWVSNKPKPSNDTYLYVVESASGSTEIEARNQTFARVLQSTAMRIGQPINSDEINKAVQSGQSFEVISSQYNIPINKVCEYTEKNEDGYRVYVLCQVAKAGNAYADFDYDYGGCYDVKGYKNSTALIMSMFLPGSGQMSKRRYGEGILTLLAELDLAVGALACYITKQQLQAEIENYNISGHVPYSSWNVYSATEDIESFTIGMKACLGVAATLYVFNLYRAYTAKPRFRKNIALAPTAIPVGSDMAYGVSFSYSF